MYLVSFGVTQALGIGTKCFIEGTLILTSVGLVKIEDIKEGDEVWSYNEETTYNFEVEDNHNYYVGEECFLVHNDYTDSYDIEFDERAIAMAKEGNPSFQTFKNRLFKYQNEIDPTLFSSYKKGLSPTINKKR